MDPTPASNGIEPLLVAPATNAYISNLESLGLLAGEPGGQQLAAETREVLTALHHVLAGGQVDVQVVSPGTASVVEDLDGQLDQALDETNNLNVVLRPGTCRL